MTVEEHFVEVLSRFGPRASSAQIVASASRNDLPSTCVAFHERQSPYVAHKMAGTALRVLRVGANRRGDPLSDAQIGLGRIRTK